ncbi:MAG: hypothetical protein NC548_30600 [Lachnospiraceae bacterium]|nr:hypothetical protein [Lachnospiraceae bacterium]
MGNKKVKTMLSVAAILAAAESAFCCAVKHGRKKKMADAKTSEPVLEEEELTEEKVREYLLWLFRLYEDSEFDDLVEFLNDGSDPREYAADNYSGLLFPYIKSNMAEVMEMEGDDGTGEEPFCMTDELFFYPACLICRQTDEAFLDRFDLYRDNEIWMLENGKFAFVNCIELKKGGGYLKYRFLDRYITKPEDIPVSFEDMEAGFNAFMEKQKTEETDSE